QHGDQNERTPYRDSHELTRDPELAHFGRIIGYDQKCPPPSSHSAHRVRGGQRQPLVSIGRSPPVDRLKTVPGAARIGEAAGRIKGVARTVKMQIGRVGSKASRPSRPMAYSAVSYVLSGRAPLRARYSGRRGPWSGVPRAAGPARARGARPV